jgi:hypothetical protein
MTTMRRLDIATTLLSIQRLSERTLQHITRYLMCTVTLRYSCTVEVYQASAVISGILSAITEDAQKSNCRRATKHSYIQTSQQTNVTKKENQHTGHSAGHRVAALKHVN